MYGKLRTWPLSVDHVFRTFPHRGAHSLVVSAADRDLGKHPERVQGARVRCAQSFHTDLVPRVVQRFRGRKVSNGCPLDAVPVSVDLEPAPDKERAAGGEHDQKAQPKAGGGEFSVQVLIGSADHDRMTRLGDTQEDAQTRSTTFWRSQCEQKDSKKSHNIKVHPPCANPGICAPNHQATIRQLTGHVSLLGVSAALSARVRRT